MTADQRDEQIRAVSFVTWVGLVLNLVLAGMKIVAGIFGNSRAVTADGIHSLSDLATDVSLLIGVRLWTAPPDDLHPYGHKRYETLLTAGIGVLLAVVAVGIVVDAAVAYSEEHIRHAQLIAFWAAVASIVIKEALYRWNCALWTIAQSSFCCCQCMASPERCAKLHSRGSLCVAGIYFSGITLG